MKRYKILKIVGICLLFVLAYELIGVFVSYGRHPKVSEETKKQTDVSEFYEKAEQPERATIIEDNEKALEQRLRLIHQAKKRLVLSTFAFHDDESGKIMIGALLDAAERGVDVKVLIDGFESWITVEGNPYFTALSSHENVKVKLYNRANPLKPWKVMGRLHDKYVIADEQFYMLGGRNTFDFFLGDFPGHRNYDRDVLVYCENPQEDSSVYQLEAYFEKVWNRKDNHLFRDQERFAKKASSKEAALETERCYKSYYEEHKQVIDDTEFEKDTLPTEKIVLISNPIHTGAKEPTAWYVMTELMKNARERVKIHTPYIICNDMMYDSWEEIGARVPEFSVMTNSIANNGNPFGAADYKKRRERILETGIDIWEYEGKYSYHGKSVLIDDDISVVGSFNMDMRSAYLDTELMLVIRSKEVNRQLEQGMRVYEQSAFQVREDGSIYNPHQVTPKELTPKKKVQMFFIQYVLDWARFLF